MSQSKCWRFTGQGVNNNSYYEYYACGINPSYQAGNGGQLLYLDGTNLGGGGYVYRSGTQAITAVSSDASTLGFQTFGGCDGCKAPKTALYDCLNGNCVKSTQYTTPGQYASLSDCQAVCANGGACGSGKQCIDPTSYCPDGKVCIDLDEYSNIQGLISKINSEVC